jgi:hypothetical protein
LLLASVISCTKSNAAPLPEKAKTKEPKVYVLLYVGTFHRPKQSIEQLRESRLKDFRDGAYFTSTEVRFCIKKKAFDFLGTKEGTLKDVKTVRDWERKHIKVESLGGTPVFRLSIEDAPLKSRAIILNSIADNYQDHTEKYREPGKNNPRIGYVIERAENP